MIILNSMLFPKAAQFFVYDLMTIKELEFRINRKLSVCQKLNFKKMLKKHTRFQNREKAVPSYKPKTIVRIAFSYLEFTSTKQLGWFQKGHWAWSGYSPRNWP